MTDTDNKDGGNELMCCLNCEWQKGVDCIFNPVNHKMIVGDFHECNCDNNWKLAQRYVAARCVGDAKPDPLTPRQLACIKLCVPESGDAEIDELITKSLRQDYVGRAMQASQWRKVADNSWLEDDGKFALYSKKVVEHCFTIVDAMIAKGGGKDA